MTEGEPKPTATKECCPCCGKGWVERFHWHGDAVVPECDYWECLCCGHQWGQE